MTELQKFQESFANKSKVTQNVYNSGYKRLHEFLGDDIANVSQKNIMKKKMKRRKIRILKFCLVKKLGIEFAYLQKIEKQTKERRKKF